MTSRVDRYDAIFFDNDGILVDTEPLFLQATQEILATVKLDTMLALPGWLGLA